MNCEDSFFIAKCLEGDVDSFGHLVAKYQNAVYGLAISFVKDFDLAQDLTQDAFIKAYEQLNRLKDQTRFSFWLKSITANLCRNWLKRKRETVSIDLIDTEFEQELQPENSPANLVLEAINKLSEKNRQIVLLYYMDEQSSREIAEFLDLSESAVDQRLHRARKQLKKEMSMIGKTCTTRKLGTEFVDQIKNSIAKQPIHELKIAEDHLPWIDSELQKSVIRGEIPEDYSLQKTKVQVDCIEQCLKLSDGDQILDLGCCYGRHSLELARRNYAVTGVDIGDIFIKEAIRLAKKESLSCNFVQLDFRTVQYKNQFDCVTILGNTLTLFSDDDIEKILAKIYQALKPSGKVLFEIDNRDFKSPSCSNNSWEKVPHGDHEDLLLHESHFDPVSGKSWSRDFCICPISEKIEEYISYTRNFSSTEFTLWLKTAGFKNIKTFADDWKGNPLTAECEIMVIRAEK